MSCLRRRARGSCAWTCRASRSPTSPDRRCSSPTTGSPGRKPYSIAAAPEDAARDGCAGAARRRRRRRPCRTAPDAHARASWSMSKARLAASRFRRRTCRGQLRLHRRAAPASRRCAPCCATPSTRPIGRIGLFYSARTPGDFAYEDEWRRLADDGRIEFRQTITRDSTAPSEWTGERGRIGREALASLVHGPATLCFVCGPPALVTDVPRLLDELGVPRERIKLEEWSPSGS